MDGREGSIGEPWINKIARITRMEKLGQLIFKKEGLGPYLFIWIIFLFAHITWQFPHYFKHGHTTIIDYFTVLFVIGITFGVWAIHKINGKYQKVLSELKIKNTEKLNILNLDRCKLFILLIGIVLSLIYYALNYQKIVEDIGYIPMILNTIFILVFSLPVITEFIAYLFYIHIIFPTKLKDLEPEIDFSDPFKKGGMEKIGELYLFNSELYFIALILYNLQYIIERFTDLGIGIGNFILSIYLGTWVVGIIFFFVPQLWIHKYMKNKKKEKIKEIYGEMEKEIGNEDECFPDVFPDDPDEMVQYVHNYLKLDMTHSQSEYPFDMAKVRELFAIAILPLALELSKILLL